MHQSRCLLIIKLQRLNLRHSFPPLSFDLTYQKGPQFAEIVKQNNGTRIAFWCQDYQCVIVRMSYRRSELQFTAQIEMLTWLVVPSHITTHGRIH